MEHKKTTKPRGAEQALAAIHCGICTYDFEWDKGAAVML